jgi:hypothetical protein
VGTAWTQSQIIHFVRDYTEKPDSLLDFYTRSPKPTDIKRLRLKMSNIEIFIEKAGSALSRVQRRPEPDYQQLSPRRITFAILML